MTRIRSESERISSSSSETSRIARPSSRSSTSRRCTNSIAPTSRPRVGCAAISTFGSRVDLAREHDLLLVAAGERRRARLRAAAAHVELLQQPSCTRDEAAREEPAELRVGLVAVVVQRDVLGERELEHEPAPLPVLGDVPEPRVERARASAPVTSSPPTRDRARSALAQAGERVDQLGLAVAVDARDADDLAGAHLERDAAHALEPAVVDDVRSSTSSSGSPGFGGVFSTRSSTSRPTISAGQRRLGRAFARRSCRSSSRAGAR